MDITLAGIANLTDLAAELQLPTAIPLPQESLFDNPQIADEALKLLNVRNDKLALQLVHALNQIPAEKIILKEYYPAPDINVDHPETPELLRAILEKNPNIFNRDVCDAESETKYTSLCGPVSSSTSPQVPSPLQNIHQMEHLPQYGSQSTSGKINLCSDMAYPNCTSSVSANSQCVNIVLQDQIVTSTNIREPSPDQLAVNIQPVVRLERLSTKDIFETKKNVLKFVNSSENASNLEVTDMEVDGTVIKEPEKPEILLMAKPKLRRVERKFVPVLAKLSPEELMKTNTYQRFNHIVEVVLENATESLTADLVNDDHLTVQEDLILNRCQLRDLCTEAAKLKALGAMEMIPIELLVQLLNVLEINVRGADRMSLIGDPEENENIAELCMEKCLDRVMGATDASLCSLYIMTSPNMPKRVYLEDCINRVILFNKFQLHSTIFPHYDAVFRINPKKRVSEKKKSLSHSSNKYIPALYNKIHELVNLLSELFNIQVMTDTTILHASSMCVPPFFAENVSELQLSCLKLVTAIFTRYEKHRRIVLDDILTSIARLPSCKHNLRSYRLNNEEQIQMFTALVLQLIQCAVALPENFNNYQKIPASNKGTPKQMNKDMLICNKYEMATKIAGTFLTEFLNKCGNKHEEIDHRPLFENFVQDLLTTVHKPEWPASEFLLSLLGNLLVKNVSNKGKDLSLRVLCLDYLGMVVARLKKHSVLSLCKINTVDQMIKDIKSEEMKDGETELKDNNINDDEESRMRFLQRVLVDFLAVNGQSDESYKYAHYFYIAQWYKDATEEKTRLAFSDNKKNNSKENHRKNRKSNDGADEQMDDEENMNNGIKRENPGKSNSDILQIIEERKKFYISKIQTFQETISLRNYTQVFQTYIDYRSAELISQYLASKRFSQSFDDYLRIILLVLGENSSTIRAKAIKCLTMIIEADPSVLGTNDMQIGVSHSFLDHSTFVREAAVDLVGKFILKRPELIDKYYDMLSARILDTGVSVRKRVIKILKDICIEYPEFPKIPEICVKMIRRVNDEEGVRKLVMEIFQNMWFTPMSERPKLDKPIVLRKVMNIIDVVASSTDIGLEWLEQLLVSLFKPKENKEDSTKINVEPPKALLLACRQIVDSLIEYVLRLEESGKIIGDQSGHSERLVACFASLNLFAKIRPELLVKHASTLQPYLSLKCQAKGDSIIISSVALTIGLVVPLIEHPSETFLAQIEEDCIKLIIQRDRTVISSCLSCLGSIVNVTRNFKLIRDCFNKYYGNVIKFKDCLEKDTEQCRNVVIHSRPAFRRAIFIVGLLLKHFDFTTEEVVADLPFDIKDQVYHTFLYFLCQEDEDIQSNTLKAIGFICSRNYEFMLNNELKKFYHKILIKDVPLKMKSDVLQNIEMYLMEEEKRMIKLDKEWDKRSKIENLKEMGDVTSGMASTIIQLYLKEILTSYLHPDIIVRHASLKVIQLVLQQGLVHPVQIVPYLICMSTDSEKMVSHSADKQLMEIEQKYPGFIHTKSHLGVRLSYQLQTMLQADIVRGYKIREQEEYPTALNGYMYLLLRSSRPQRRALVLNMLKQFDDQHTSLSYMLYMADNLAYFPYIMQDEPLFIIHQIDIIVSLTGNNLLISFRQGLIATESEKKQMETTDASMLDEDDEDEESLIARLPSNTVDLQGCITAAQGCLLLLVLKHHLKDIHGLTDAKILQYSPTKVAKVYEKTATRRNNTLFNPKATLNRLKQGAPSRLLDTTGKKDLIAQYLDFKHLMLKLDLEDFDDEEKISFRASIGVGDAKTTSFTSGPGSVPNEIDPSMVTSFKGTPPKVPKLMISRRKSERRSTPGKALKPRKLFE